MQAFVEAMPALVTRHEAACRRADLLDVEKALAETQGEIDTARSELSAMRARVATSDLTLTYSSRSAVSGAWRPVEDAVQGAVSVFAQALAVLIVLVAALLPFAVVVGIAAWLWRSSRRRRDRTRAPPE